MENETQEDSRGQVASPQPAVLLEGWRKHALIAYNILLAIGLSCSLIYCVAFLKYEPDSSRSKVLTQALTMQSAPNHSSDPTPATQPMQSDSKQTAQSESSNQQKPPLPPAIWLAAMLTMIAAGGLAGVLRNLHGLFIHSYEEKGLPAELEQHYYLRPLTGAILGLLTLFLGHLMTSTLSDGANLTWTTPTGRMPYTGIALLAGFACQELIGRMKAVAETLFQERHIPMRYQLRGLIQLRDDGFITEEEYEQIRKSIISKELLQGHGQS